jgi:hypothetical protein
MGWGWVGLVACLHRGVVGSARSMGKQAKPGGEGACGPQIPVRSPLPGHSTARLQSLQGNDCRHQKICRCLQEVLG